METTLPLTKKQQYELVAAITARGEIPVKFVYLGEGAKRWDRIYRHWSKTDDLTDEELHLLLSHIDGFLNVFEAPDGINVIDLGCGNGLPATYILDELNKRNIKTSYIAVDISQPMIELAKKNIGERFPDIDIKPIHLDFEKEGLTEQILAIKEENNYANLLINSGNTLGNYINAAGVLTNFMESMTLDDYLLIGNGLSNDQNPHRIIHTYNIPLIIDTVTAPAKDLHIFKPKVDEFRYAWNPNLNRVEGRITLNEDKRVMLAEQVIELEKGDEILVHRSHKYTESALMRLLSEVGFRTELLTTTKNRNYALAMVQPTRYSAT